MYKKLSLFSIFLLLSVLIIGCSTKQDNIIKEIADTKPIILEDETRYVDPIFSGLKIEKDIVYRTANAYSGEEVELTLDLYEPLNDTEQKRPVIIFIHGGGLSTGSKDDAFMLGLAERFSKKGM
jgi:acetyl esterase/lipase